MAPEWVASWNSSRIEDVETVEVPEEGFKKSLSFISNAILGAKMSISVGKAASDKILIVILKTTTSQ